MTITDAAVIQELIVCSPKQLTDVAKKHDLSASRAQVVRDHWVRRITSRCVQCNVLVTGDKCPQCKTPKQPATKLLQEVKPKEVILRRECACGRPFYYSAGYILKMFAQKGAFKPSSKCPQCRDKEKKLAHKRPTAKKALAKRVNAQASQTKKVKTARPKNPKAKKPSRGLTYRPFAALEGLKVKK
jgi:hypothetical protein